MRQSVAVPLGNLFPSHTELRIQQAGLICQYEHEERRKFARAEGRVELTHTNTRSGEFSPAPSVLVRAAVCMGVTRTSAVVVAVLPVARARRTKRTSAGGKGIRKKGGARRRRTAFGARESRTGKCEGSMDSCVFVRDARVGGDDDLGSQRAKNWGQRGDGDQMSAKHVGVHKLGIMGHLEAQQRCSD